jgi:heat shock protein HtpX
MNLYSQIAANKRKSIALILGLLVFVVLIVAIFSYAYGYDPLVMSGLALIITGIYSFFSYYNSGNMVMALSGAKEIKNKHDAFELFTLVENLCIGAGLPLPRIYIIEDTAPNAFATGRDPKHAALCFTTGILTKLNRAELEGVVAHELSHVKNYDIRFISLVVVLVGVVALLSDLILRMTIWGGMGRDRDNRGGSNPVLILIGLALAILAPIIASIIQFAVSRQREFLADASAAYLTRNPEGLARALEVISADTEPLEAANNATASLYIANPLKGQAVHWFSGLFNTHPPIEERVARLRAM